MANLSSLASSAVKAVYTGTAVLHFGAGTFQTTVTFPATTAKCLLMFTACWDPIVPFVDVNPWSVPGMTGHVTGGTIVFTVNRGLAAGALFVINVDWQVVEFN